MRRRCAVILPLLFIAVSLLLFFGGYYGVRSKAFRDQVRAASMDEREPPLIPYLLPAALVAAIRGPAVIFSTFDIGEGRNLMLLPTGILWWWWVGAQLDRSIRRDRRQTYLWAILFAIVAILFACMSVVVIVKASEYWRLRYFGVYSWRAAMWTADAFWLSVLTGIAALKSIASFRDRSIRNPTA
jgi:hypothetical protein